MLYKYMHIGINIVYMYIHVLYTYMHVYHIYVICIYVYSICICMFTYKEMGVRVPCAGGHDRQGSELQRGKNGNLVRIDFVNLDQGLRKSDLGQFIPNKFKHR